MRHYVMVSLLLSALMGGAGCAKNPATGERDFMLMSEDAEFELGHETVQAEIKQHGLYKEKPALTDYYQKIGHKVVAVTERSEKPFEFIMLDSEDFNAWATPGYINVYRGILPFVNSEAEFVALISHEAGHVSARHAARTISASKASQGLMLIGAVLLASQTDSDQLAYTALGAAGVAAQFGFAKYSRDHEDEADKLALRYMESMGYEPAEAAGLYKTMAIYQKLSTTIYKYFNDGEEPSTSYTYDLLASHPDPEARQNLVFARAGELPANYKLAGRDTYLKMIDGIAFGPNFREFGAAGERTLYLPKKRAKLTLPEGFLMVVHANKGWYGYQATTKSEMLLETKSVAKDEDPEETLRTAFPKAREIEKMTINGLTAYTATKAWTKAGNWGQKENIGTERLFVIKGGLGQDGSTDKRTAFILRFMAPTEQFDAVDASFKKAAQTFTPLSTKQANAIQPLRVKVHTVKKGETVESLSAKLPFGAMKKEWFQALNSLYDAETLKVGQKVKLVVDPNTP